MGTLHLDICCRHLGSITATIDLLNADVTRHHLDSGLLACCSVVGQVTATIDSCHFVNVRRCHGRYFVGCGITGNGRSADNITIAILDFCRPVDSHRHVTLW